MTFFKKQNVKIIPLSNLRKAVRASASVSKSKNIFHLCTEVDITNAINKIEDSKRIGQNISITSFITKTFALTIKKNKWMNSFIANGKQIFLDDITISILMEREIDGISVPEPMVVKNVVDKTPYEIKGEIDLAKEKSRNGNSLGDLTKSWYIKFIPGFLLKMFVKLADQNINVGIKYGKLAITSIGMFATRPIWIIPHGSATILVSIGTITQDKTEPEKSIIHLTVSFDHDIIDGGPAARFVEELCSEIEKAQCI